MKKYTSNFKRGSAVALCLVFATVLLVMGLAYSKLTVGSKRQTVQIDERIKLDYLAHGMTELAMLKFQLYPADFYACDEAANYGAVSYLQNFGDKAPEFCVVNDNNSQSSFDKTGISLQLATMTILTDNKWNNEVLYIAASATYTDQYGRHLDKDVVRVVDITRVTIKP